MVGFNPFAALGIEFYGFLLPWIFTFAIVYGLLMKANLFGGANNRISIALAFVIAFFVTAAGGPAMAEFFINLFAGASAFLAGIIVMILFVAILGYGKAGEFKHWAALAAVIIIGIILFVASTGAFIGGQIYLRGQRGSIIFWLIIIIIAIYLVTKEKKTETPAAPKKE
jgi:hypothetical protein